MDLMDLLGGRPPENEGAGLTPIQVVTQLREVMVQTQEGIEQDDFVWGDVLQHRFPSLATVSKAEDPCIFVEYLMDPIHLHEIAMNDPADIYSNSAATTVDCKILKHSRGTASVFFATSAHYRLHPDFQRNAHAS